jgi:DNA-binding winged helix-turn-helix (wHTH) protein/tetratricopeptide (TPR) repeat protein
VQQPADEMHTVCFGSFEVNLATGELRKQGIRLKLQDQPFQVLTMLLARPGQLVNREEIRQKLWPSGTFVDFDNGLNAAINRLREALGDSAENPRFIETHPRRGYRFVAPVERLNGNTIPVTEAKPEPQPPRSKPWLRLASASIVAVLLLAAIGAWRFYHSPKTALNFGARDWVLISSFQNRTGEPVLDGTLEYALERELSNSQFVNVVPRERVGDVLRLMRKPLDTKIDAVLGREICLRDGGIRALLTGRIDKLGTTYVLSAELVDPAHGVSVASMSEEDPADSQMAAAVRRLSNRVRETLGEKSALIQQSEKSLEKVTTPSLHALQLYTKADELMRAPADNEAAAVANQAAAAELLRQALAEDPSFASAHLLLGFTFLNREKEAEAKPEFQRALDLADTTPDRERLFILGSYYGAVKKDHPKAIEVYEALLKLYPDHYWAANNLEDMYLGGGRRDDSWRMTMRLADLRPDDIGRNEVVACVKYSEKDPDGARPYMERARTALAAANPKGPATDDFVRKMPIFNNWAEGKVALAHQQLQDVEGAQEPPFSDPDLFFPLAFGELAEGERMTRLGDPKYRIVDLGLVELLKGDLQAAKKNFAVTKDDMFTANATALVWLGRCGLWDKVDRIILKSRYDPRASEIVRGEHAIAHGQTKEGIALLESGIEAMQNFPKGAFYLGSETLARAYEQQGNLDAALLVLQRASNAKGKAFGCLGGNMSGAYWLRIELQLADLYREMGRGPEAEKVENELRKMLIYADADHPILRELQKRKAATTAASSK